MKTRLEELKSVALSIVEKAKVRKGLILGMATFFVFQLYFVRELLAAELLFAGVFAVLLVLGGLAYLVGSLGERGLDYAEVGVRVMSVRRVAASAASKSSAESRSVIRVQNLSSSRTAKSEPLTAICNPQCAK